MNSTHGLAGAGGVTFGGALVGILHEQFGMSTTLATNWVIAAASVAAAAGALFVWWLQWKYPTVPLPPVFEAQPEPPPSHPNPPPAQQGA